MRHICLAVLIALSVTGCSAYGSESARNLPPINRVIMLCVDTFRADQVREDLTPNLYRLAHQSVYYTNCRSAAPWTLPSTTATFTGKYPSYAGAIDKYDNLPDAEITLAKVFQQNGWTTAGLSANALVSKSHGYDSGFDQFTAKGQLKAENFVNRTINMIEGLGDQNYYLYLHMFDPHTPYAAPQYQVDKWRRGSGRFTSMFNLGYTLHAKEITITEGEAEQIRGLYDAECAYADFQIGRLIRYLKENDLWDDTMFIFFSDHGEELGEHDDWFHDHTLHDTVMRVPLTVRFPETEAYTVDELSSLRQIGQIMFERLGFRYPSQFEFNGIHYIEGVKRGEEQKGIISPDMWKLFVMMESREVFFYDLNNDPAEVNNLWDPNDEHADGMLREMNDIFFNTPETGSGQAIPTEEQLEELRALGYIQ